MNLTSTVLVTTVSYILPLLLQGITLKMVDGKVVIARILHGGLIHKQGLLQVGDRIVKVNHEEVGSMTPLELQDMLVSVVVVVVVDIVVYFTTLLSPRTAVEGVIRISGDHGGAECS